MLSDRSWPIEKGRNGLHVWRLNRILPIIQEKILTLEEKDRELPIVWSVAHMFTTMQLAKILALRRNIDPEIAGLAGVFHDIYTMITGKTEDHGVKAKTLILEIIEEYNNKRREALPMITTEEVNQIIYAIEVHSNKNDRSEHPLVELLRDADSLDSYIHGMTPGRKSGRIPRINGIMDELGINHTITL